jgi:dTDP-glucose pyrophosphorylase
MPNIQILMPMGGLGSRFADQGYTTPKALIPVDGKPMFKRALDSFTPLGGASYLFVIRREHEDQYQLGNQIRKELPGAKITILDGNTRGAAETAMMATADIDDDLPIIIADCDIYFESQEYMDKIHQVITTGKPDGMLLTFNSSEPRFSYVALNETGKAVRTAEKVVISNHAILGGYFFRSGKLFKELGADFLAHDLPDGLKEYFMSHLFNILLEKNGEIEIATIDKMHVFGTPEELNAYFAEHPQPIA